MKSATRRDRSAIGHKSPLLSFGGFSEFQGAIVSAFLKGLLCPFERTFQLDGTPFTVLGVMPSAMAVPLGAGIPPISFTELSALKLLESPDCGGRRGALTSHVLFAPSQ